jgi:hypothetical protein
MRMMMRIGSVLALLVMAMAPPADAQGVCDTTFGRNVKRHTDSVLARHTGSGTHNISTRKNIDSVAAVVARCQAATPPQPPPPPPPNKLPIPAIGHSCVLSTGGDYRCTFDGSGSKDLDGVITAYLWRSPGKPDRTGVQAIYGFPPTADSQTVTLTVTDDSSATATGTLRFVLPVAPPPPPPPPPDTTNQAPHAVFTSNCTGLTTTSGRCDFNGSGSTDADGTITRYEWIIPACPSATTPTVSCTFSAPFSVQVILNVWDNDGAQGSAQAIVQVPALPQTPPTGTVPSTAPALPQATVDVSWPAIARTLSVAVGGNLQAALDSARKGDEIVLPAGATWTGNYTLGAKTGAGWITVRTSALAQLPPLGSRIDPAQHAALMPKIVTPNVLPAIATRYNTPGINGWRLVGLEITVAAGATTEAPNIQQGIVNFGQGDASENTVAKLPRDLILDRSYVHGNPLTNTKRCVRADAISVAVIGSHLLECHGKGFDSQAILAYNSTGPFLFENNRLEAAGEVIMFGGSLSLIGIVPADATIRRNILTRPLAWQTQGWVVKNLFELKNVQRVLFEQNILENHWAGGQAGATVVLGTADNPCAFCIVSDVTFQWNQINNVAGVFNLFPNYGNAQPMRRVKLANNLITNAGASGLTIGGTLYHYQLQSNVDDLWIENNTGFGVTQHVNLDGALKKARFTFRNNLGGSAPYVWWSSSGGGETANSVNLTSPYLITNNCFVAPATAPLPTGSLRAGTVATAATTCPGIGVDQVALQAKLAGVR